MTDKEALLKEFLERFPISKLKTMTLEEYTDTKRENSFCYWIENKLKDLGGIQANSAIKFGIYKYKKSIEKWNGCNIDNEYIWQKKLGETREEAFETIKNQLFQVAVSAQNSDFAKIEEIDLQRLFKWKLAFLYSQNFVHIYNETWLRWLCKELKPNANVEALKQYELYAEIMKFKPEEQNIFDYTMTLVEKYRNAHNTQYWIVGCFSNRKNVSWFEEFIQEKKWIDKYGETGNEKYKDQLDKINEGDIFVLKSSYTKGTGHQISCTKIKAIGIVTKKNNWFDFSVDWFNQTEKEFIGLYYAKTIEKIRKDNLLQYVKEIITMKNQQNTNKTLDEYIELLEENHNLIFHGAPGTGKTYTAKLMAAKMILTEAIKEENMTPVQKTEFESRCGFVQFHPSYDYTDFVEGIRPNANANGFERKDGVFKEFCKRALENKQTNDICDEIKNDATVWKVSLAKSGENEIRTDCLENGYIRIGWAKYGDVDFDEQKFDDLNYTNLRMLRWFQKEMKVGDIVVSCFSSESTDAIGIIEGDYEYRGDSGEFPRFRKVKWLVKGINENIVELNRDRIMIGQTLYQMWIRPYQIKEILKKYTKQAIQTEPSNQSLPYIFIIDEINRGETSKIFGELFYSLDPGYRGKNKVKNAIPELSFR